MLLFFPKINFGQAPDLGSAGNFALFTSVGAVSNSGISYNTKITGHVGSNSAPSITGFGNVNGQMHYVSDPVSSDCAADLLLAYNTLGATIPDSTIGVVIGNGDTLLAGIYLMPGAASLNLDLFLDAKGDPNAVFIFKTALAFSTSANAKVHLINGALACNVFWKLDGAVTMGNGTTFRGTIISGGAISLSTNDTLEGRALTVAGAIFTDQVLIYTPIGCGSPILNGPVAPVLGTTSCYALFSSIGGVIDDGATFVNGGGDVGNDKEGLTTGFDPLKLTGNIHSGDFSTALCASDLLNVYNYLVGLAPGDIELLYPAQFGHNLVLTPHTYIMLGAVVLTDTVFLNAGGNADAVFIILVNGAFSTSTYSKVILTNGTQAKNVYWKIDGQVDINDYSIFNGTIISKGAISLKTGVILNGRALTGVGALATSAMTVNTPVGCGLTMSPNIDSVFSNQTVCAGDSVSFIVTSIGTNITYQWRKNGLNISNSVRISGATTDTLLISNVELSDTANYDCVVSNDNATDTSNMAKLAVNASVNIVASDDLCIIYGNNATINATGASTYTWSNEASTQSISVNPTQTITYKVTGYVGECFTTEQVVVKVSDMAIASINTTGLVSCNGSEDGFGRVIMVENNGDYTYNWSNGFTLDTVFGLSGGTYKVTVKDVNACELVDSLVLFEPNYFADVYNLSYKNKADKSVVISWNKNNEATSFFAMINKVGDNAVRYLSINPTDTFVIIYLLEPNTEYQFKIRQFKNETTYSCMTSVSFTTLEAIENTCVVTSGLKASCIGTVTSQLNWDKDENAVSYMLRWRVKSPQGTWRYYNATAGQTSVVVGDLTANTQYEWQIRKFCLGSFYADFTALAGSEFTTSATETCAQATSISVTGIANNSVILNWTNANNNKGYMVRWRIKGTQNWIYYNANENVNTYNVEDLIANTEYEWHIRTFCKDNTVSPFTELYQFKTGPNCPDVKNLGQEIGNTYAVLKWDAVQGVNHYLLRWRIEGGAWKYIQVNEQTNRQQIGCGDCEEVHKLVTNTSYEWQIRSFCDAEATLYSNFSAIQQFNTLEVKSLENVSGKLSINNSSLLINTFPNPFKDEFTISYNIPKTGNLTIELFNLNGQKMSSIIDNEYQQAGNHSVNYSLKDNESNIYFIRLIYNNEVKITKVVKL